MLNGFTARPARAETWAALLALAYFIAISALAMLQHATFHTRARDMGIYAQVLWNTAHGRPLASTLLADNSLHVAEHVAPVLAVIAPLYALWPEPMLLLGIQQACLAAAGFVLFRWAHRECGAAAAFAVMAGYFAMPAMSRVALSEFHPVVMAALPVALGLSAALSGRLRASVAWLLVSLLFEEETAPIVGTVGAYLLLGRRARSGLAVGALAVCWLGLAALVAMPAFQERGRGLRDVGRAAGHFDQVRENPGLLAEWLTGERGAEAALWLIAPTAGTALLAPEITALAIPTFAILFAQDREGTYAGHWSAPMLPILWFAAARGIRRLRGAPRGALLSRAVVAGLALASTLGYWRFSIFPGGRGFDADRFEWTERSEALARAGTLISADARLDASRFAVPHLAHRPEVYQFPSTFYSAPMRPDLARIDTFLLDLTDTPTRRALDATDQDTVATRRPRMHVWSLSQDVVLLTRARPTTDPTPIATYGDALSWAAVRSTPHGAEQELLLYWEVLARPGPWLRTLQVTDAAGNVVLERRDAPLDEILPVTRWERGQVIVERIIVPSSRADLTAHVAWVHPAGSQIPVSNGTPSFALNNR
ncbi:MAG: DUF2079 domain-containing protein [Chloroflexota bacterium]